MKKGCGESCPICLDHLGQTAVFVDCGHSFCDDCLLASLAGEKTLEGNR